jgi:hypothetical protein
VSRLRRTATSLFAAAIAIAGGGVLGVGPASAVEADATVTDDHYQRVIYHGHVPPWRLLHIHGACADGYYLDKHIGTPGLKVGQGFQVQREDVVSVVEFSSERRGPVHEHMQTIRGTTLEVFNVAVTAQALKITMFCTSSPDRAWRAPWGHPAP